ncbi:MAG: hypothetical protein ABWY57_06995 [Mycetocola sp.]
MSPTSTDKTGSGHIPSAPPYDDVDCGCNGDGSCDPPHALERNRFYPRKRMEVRHWQVEQRYHRGARQLVTRLGLGSGVLCGLEFESAAGVWIIRKGVGVDGRGRIIVVRHDIEVDVTRLTDECGLPTDETATDGTVTVALCYRECGTDLVALPAEECDGKQRAVASMVREAFAVSVTRGESPRVGLPDGLCEALLAGAEGVDRRELLDRLDPRLCACAEECIPLATVDFGEGGATARTEVRTVIRSNRQLLDLILCLAERVEECCAEVSPAVAPRIVALWPLADENGDAFDQLLKNRTLELGFDRDMAETGLDDPQNWLGVWLLDEESATRLPLQRSGAGLTHVTPPAGGDGAAFSIEFDSERLSERSVFVVMARSTAGGPIRAAGTDQLALDAELTATGLSQEQRDKLWGLPADGNPDGGLGGLVGDAISAPPVFLPTGDGTAGGEMHVVVRPRRLVESPPRLLSVWPRGATILGEESPELKEEWRSFLEIPRIEIVVSRPLADAALETPDAWLRVWHATADGETFFGLRQIKLFRSDEQALDDGVVRYVFSFTEEVEWYGRDEVLVQLRSTPPVVTESPIGRDHPEVLLDADFRGTVLDSQTLFRVWSGDTFDNGIPAFQPSPTEGESLHDGIAGGLAHWAFTATRP